MVAAASMANSSAIVVFATTGAAMPAGFAAPQPQADDQQRHDDDQIARQKVAKSIIHSGDAGVALIRAKRKWFNCSITVTSSCGANSR